MIEVFTTCAAALLALAPGTDSLAGSYSVFDGQGRESSLEAVCEAAREVNVVFLGETHDDPTGHAIQAVLLEAIARTADAEAHSPRPGILAMEMFEQDIQLVVNEYLRGEISERDFLAASRPWSNYATDYRPLVETAKLWGWRVIASNAPARYVRLATRDGRDALTHLATAGRATLPPLNYADASDALGGKFTALMGDMAGHGGGGPSVAGMLQGQNLRDASMAFWTVEAMRLNPGAQVVHVNGSFHSAGRLGIMEHMARYAPDATQIVITMEPTGDLGSIQAALDGSDFIILTDDNVVPSRNPPRE